MTVRLTVAQALVRFLAAQYSERDGVEQRLIPGCFGIFGHGNVAGIGQALLESQPAGEEGMPYVLPRNEQAMVHTAAGYARARNRLATFACTTSTGPGATNLVTGAALATINRLPVLLLPGDVFATRVANPVLQELEDPRSLDLSVNDCLRPVSRWWDRVNRPEQLPSSLLGAMRVLTDPSESGAVTLALPQDVQAEAWDWPAELFERRVWHVARPRPEPSVVAAAAALLRGARRPLIVAGGGTIYSEATDVLRAFVRRTGIPVAETQAGKGALDFDDPCAVGAIGATGTTAANALAADADVVLGIGTRWTDFTTASRTVFAHPDVRFVNLNVAAFDAVKHAGLALVADARAALEALDEALAGWSADPAHTARARTLADAWEATVQRAFDATVADGEPLVQTAVIGALERVGEPRDVIVCAAGSLPGDLHKLWRTRDPKGYHVEYGYSCMGYEIAGGLGVKLADPTREVIVLVGDASYLMMAQEIATAVQERVKLTIVLVDNGGFASIGALSEAVGGERLGTAYRSRDERTGLLTGEALRFDLGATAAGLGADVVRVTTIAELEQALRAARRATVTTVVCVTTDPGVRAPSSEAWWDVPVAAVAAGEPARAARAAYERAKDDQRTYLTATKAMTR